MKKMMAVITKKALEFNKIHLATHTDEIMSDYDSGWRLQVGDEDEKCFERMENIALISLEKACKISPHLSPLFKDKTDNKAYQFSSEKNEFITL